jgi:hypothetical protein
VVTTPDRIVVVDNTKVRIYNASGQQQGGTIYTEGRADVVSSTDFIVAIGESTVRIFDLLGHLILSIHTQGQAEVIICPDNFTIIDNTRVRIYSLSGGLLVSSTITGPANVIACRCNFSPLNHAPMATNDVATTMEDMAVTVPVLNNDADPDNDQLTVVGLATPVHGTATTNGVLVTYTPNPNFNGADSFSYTVSDAELTDTATVIITVVPVNDAPSFTKGPDQIISQNAGAQVVPNWATNISAGPTNENGQSVTFSLTSDKPYLFAGQPALTAAGTLTYQPAANATGSAVVTVILKDNGGTANGGADTSLPQTFTITILQPATLLGSVNLQGRAAQPDPAWAIPLRVTLTPAGGITPVYTFTPTTDVHGQFSLTGIVPGVYDIRVKGQHTLRNLAQNVSLMAGHNTYHLGTLLEGDVEIDNTFNQVALADFDRLSYSFHRCAWEHGFVANADLDENDCITLPDFGLLSGNFNRQGDVVVTATAGLSLTSPLENGDQALLAFNVEELQVQPGEVVTLSIEIDPRSASVNGSMVHLRFDPALVEVVNLSLTDSLPLTLVRPRFGNQAGVLRFGRGLLGQTLNDKFTLATLAVRLKAATPGTTITWVKASTTQVIVVPVDAFPVTDVSGPSGSVLAEVRGVTLKTTAGDVSPNPTKVFLPIINKD